MVAARIANLKRGLRSDTSIEVSAITQPEAADMLNVSMRKRAAREGGDR